MYGVKYQFENGQRRWVPIQSANSTTLLLGLAKKAQRIIEASLRQRNEAQAPTIIKRLLNAIEEKLECKPEVFPRCTKMLGSGCFRNEKGNYISNKHQRCRGS